MKLAMIVLGYTICTVGSLCACVYNRHYLISRSSASGYFNALVLPLERLRVGVKLAIAVMVHAQSHHSKQY